VTTNHMLVILRMETLASIRKRAKDKAQIRKVNIHGLPHLRVTVKILLKFLATIWFSPLRKMNAERKWRRENKIKTKKFGKRTDQSGKAVLESYVKLILNRLSSPLIKK